jgi:hypothetical protein
MICDISMADASVMHAGMCKVQRGGGGFVSEGEDLDSIGQISLLTFVYVVCSGENGKCIDETKCMIWSSWTSP